MLETWMMNGSTECLFVMVCCTQYNTHLYNSHGGGSGQSSGGKHMTDHLSLEGLQECVCFRLDLDDDGFGCPGAIPRLFAIGTHCVDLLLLCNAFLSANDDRPKGATI